MVLMALFIDDTPSSFQALMAAIPNWPKRIEVRINYLVVTFELLDDSIYYGMSAIRYPADGQGLPRCNAIVFKTKENTLKEIEELLRT